MAISLLGKLAIGTVAGTAIATPTALYLAPPWSVELTKEKLQEFQKSQGFDSCYTFLSNKDKSALLFLCLKQTSGLPSKKTHVANYYFYNGGNWEQALSLGRKLGTKDVLLVRTRTWWGEKDREINNSDEPEADLKVIGEKEMQCNFQPSQVTGHNKKGEKFVCFVQPNPQLKWKLQDFE